MKKIRASVIGASGYTGAELVRILLTHPNVEIVSLIAESNAGQPISAIYPHFSHADLPDLIHISKANWKNVDVAFCCLPHGTTHEVAASLPKHVKIIDISADFRINDLDTYKHWYEKEHKAPKLQKEAVYGLTEINREKIKKARLVACPGCYPTSALLPLIPLLQAKVISQDGIIIDSKSGISGAGRSAKTANLFTEINESVKAYGIGGHRHVAEMEQELSTAFGKDVQMTFTPQVVPMNRGILSVIYVNGDGKKIAATLTKKYKNEPFVKVFDNGYAPTTRDVLGTNMSMIGVFADRIKGRTIIISVIDNLTKGASGQAVQNMNLVFGLDETTGLSRFSVFP